MTHTDPTFRSDVTVELLGHLGSDDWIAERARASTGGAPKTHEQNVNLVRKLLAEKHRKPLEHVVMCFHLEMPMFVARQFDTYRHQSRSELSLRYTDHPGEFYLPGQDRPMGQTGSRMAYEMIELAGDDRADALLGMEGVTRDAWHEYQHLLELGVSRELARTVLPVSAYTTIETTINLLSVFHIVSERIRWGEKAADPMKPQYEIELVARAMWEITKTVAPAACEALEQRRFNI
jgi:thymidylate synthase (FAD)